MRKLANILYGANSLTCIFIGLMHTYAHYTELVTAELREVLDHPIVVSGIDTNVWKLWQGMSLMMGILLIIIGLLQLFILKSSKNNSYPPLGGSFIMILMLVFVIYAGYNFFSTWQVYGGIIGVFIQLMCIFLTVRND